MEKNFKVGEFIFCEFELQMVKEMEGEEVTSVTDGNFFLSGNSLTDRCFPLDLKTKCISDSFSYWHNRFHKECQNLNYPDLNRELISKWVNAVEVKEDEDALKKAMSNLEEFGKDVLKAYKSTQEYYVSGVKLFR